MATLSTLQATAIILIPPCTTSENTELESFTQRGAQGLDKIVLVALGPYVCSLTSLNFHFLLLFFFFLFLLFRFKKMRNINGGHNASLMYLQVLCWELNQCYSKCGLSIDHHLTPHHQSHPKPTNQNFWWEGDPGMCFNRYSSRRFFWGLKS